MKVSVTTYSFSKLIKAGKMTQFDCIQKAKDMGFDAIDITEIQPIDGRTAKEQAILMAEELKRVEIPVSSYTVGADLLTGCDGNLDAEIARLKEQVDIAEMIGAPLMRHDATFGYGAGTRSYRGFMNALPRLVEGCRQITKYVKEKGIRTMTENHGQFAQDSDRMELLINTVADENYGWLVDIGNFMCVDEDPVTAVGRAAAYAFHVHAKDFHFKSGMSPDPGAPFRQTRGGNFIRGAIVGQGSVPVLQCLRALKAAGYDGYVSVEYEGIEDVLFGIETGCSNLKKYIAMVG